MEIQSNYESVTRKKPKVNVLLVIILISVLLNLNVFVFVLVGFVRNAFAMHVPRPGVNMDYIESAFDVDGSHRELCRTVKEKINFPSKPFRHVSTQREVSEDKVKLKMVYRTRGKNNEIHDHTVVAEAELDGTIIEITYEEE